MILKIKHPPIHFGYPTECKPMVEAFDTLFKLLKKQMDGIIDELNKVEPKSDLQALRDEINAQLKSVEDKSANHFIDRARVAYTNGRVTSYKEVLLLIGDKL